MTDTTYTTKSGKALTDADIEQLADEATTTGYDIDALKRRRRGRPLIGSAPAEVVPVRLDPELRAAVEARSSADVRGRPPPFAECCSRGCSLFGLVAPVVAPLSWDATPRSKGCEPCPEALAASEASQPTATSRLQRRTRTVTGRSTSKPPESALTARKRAGGGAPRIETSRDTSVGVQGATRAKVEQRRDERLAAIERMPMRNSRFSPGTTVAELTDWWLDSVARHQVRTSTLDSYRKFAGYLSADLGSLPVIDVGAETLTTWQSTLLDRFAPYTVLNCRKVCRQAFAEAVKVGLIPSNPFDLVRAPRGKRVSAGRALSTNEAKALITASQSLRLGAAVTLLFVQGWRVSEVLGLAWEDLDLDAGTAQIRRGAAYTPSVGTVLDSTKTSGAEGIHYLAPISVAHLRQRRAEQEVERDRLLVVWPVHQYDGIALSMVFTTTHGGLVNRQSVTKEIERAAKIAGLDPTGLASHSGRRTVITALYADGRLDLADVARHVGHSDTATTAEYVRSLGQRPADTARRAAELLDPTMSTQP